MSSTSPSGQPKTDSTPPSDYGWNLHQTLHQLIGFADAKAGGLLAAAAVIFALLLQSKPTLSLFDILALVCLALCALCAGCAFFPFFPFRLRGNHGNPVSWRWIRRAKLLDYQNKVDTLNSSEVNKYYAEENYEISKELWLRFALVESSIAFLIAGLVFAALYFLFLPK